MSVSQESPYNNPAEKRPYSNPGIDTNEQPGLFVHDRRNKNIAPAQVEQITNALATESFRMSCNWMTSRLGIKSNFWGFTASLLTFPVTTFFHYIRSSYTTLERASSDGRLDILEGISSEEAQAILHLAKDESTIDSLVAKGAIINDAVIQKAYKNKEFTTAKALMTHDNYEADVNTSIYIATKMEDTTILGPLLETEGADKSTPLRLAIKQGYIAGVRLLINRNDTPENLFSLSTLAENHGHTALSKNIALMLVEREEGITNIRDQDSGYTLLNFLIKNGNTEYAIRLIDRIPEEELARELTKPNLEHAREERLGALDALHYAVEMENYDVTKALLNVLKKANHGYLKKQLAPNVGTASRLGKSKVNHLSEQRLALVTHDGDIALKEPFLDVLGYTSPADLQKLKRWALIRDFKMN